LLAGMTQPVLNHQGRYYNYLNVPMETGPVQKPHPPLWYGCHYGPETTVWPAKANCNISLLQTAANARPMVERFTAEWHKAHDGSGKPFPRIGLTRTLVIACDRAAAESRGRRAYAAYYASMNKLWNRYGGATAHFPADFDTARQGGGIIAGTAAEVRDTLAAQIEQSGVNYGIVRFAFGDVTEDEAVESLELFASEIMPHIQAPGPVALRQVQREREILPSS
jgi:alkanesulfonate monooxygenase SsuD/methylene tetrahydromethanopterin reductase-like flavin-dependent oxidoreductase (luciferase family)